MPGLISGPWFLFRGHQGQKAQEPEQGGLSQVVASGQVTQYKLAQMDIHKTGSNGLQSSIPKLICPSKERQYHCQGPHKLIGGHQVTFPTLRSGAVILVGRKTLLRSLSTSYSGIHK